MNVGWPEIPAVKNRWTERMTNKEVLGPPSNPFDWTTGTTGSSWQPMNQELQKGLKTHRIVKNYHKRVQVQVLLQGWKWIHC